MGILSTTKKHEKKKNSNLELLKDHCEDVFVKKRLSIQLQGESRTTARREGHPFVVTFVVKQIFFNDIFRAKNYAGLTRLPVTVRSGCGGVVERKLYSPVSRTKDEQTAET